MTFSTVLLIALVLVLAGVVSYLLLSRKGKAVSLATWGGNGPSFEDSLIDPVTKLYNKKHLMQRLQECMAKGDRDKKNLALVLWDIDGFVQFNNEFGHKEGDKLLRQVASSIKRTVRVYDEIFRAGPDEFCAILSPSDEDIAKEVTRRVSQLVAKELFDAGAEFAGRSFTLSAGHVFYPGESQSAEALLHAANQALYRSRLTTTGA